jgi:hypothetical protein
VIVWLMLEQTIARTGCQAFSNTCRKPKVDTTSPIGDNDQGVSSTRGVSGIAHENCPDPTPLLSSLFVLKAVDEGGGDSSEFRGAARSKRSSDTYARAMSLKDATSHNSA